MNFKDNYSITPLLPQQKQGGIDNRGKEVIMFEQDEAYNENLKRLEKIVNGRGYVFNPDAKRLNKVVGLMTRNYKEFGKYYCPCKQHHPLDQEVDPLCPCEDLDKEINDFGHCTCYVFYKKDDKEKN